MTIKNVELKQRPKNGKAIIISWDLPENDRWDEEEFAPRFEDNTAIHSARVAQYATILSLVEEKLFNKKIDKMKMLGGGIFHDYEERYTGSMKHSTKRDPLVSGDINEVEIEYKEKITGFFSKSLQPIFKEFLFAEDDTYEGKLLIAIDTFDAMMFAHREAINNNLFFKDTFDEMYSELRKLELPSIQWALDEFDKKEGVYKFFMDILNLHRIKRWKSKRNVIKDNDGMHTFRTTVLIIFNAFLEKIKYGNKRDLDFFRATAKMLFHDLPEIKGGDVKGPLKHSTPERKKRFAEHEKRNALTMINGLPEFLRENFVDFMIEAKSDDFEGELVEICDKLDALVKATYELENNRRRYEETHRKLLNKIQEKFYDDYEHVKFFLSNIYLDILFEKEDE